MVQTRTWCDKRPQRAIRTRSSYDTPPSSTFQAEAVVTSSSLAEHGCPYRWPLNLSTRTARDAILDLPMSGLCTRKLFFSVFAGIILQALQCVVTDNVCRSLSAVHGIPKVHFKGKHKEYYIMVRRVTHYLRV